MATKIVYLSKDVYFVCMTHAQMSEKEEIMGLLIGNIVQNTAYIYDLCVLERSDKRKDRVEISPEQLASASAYAESLSQIHGVTFRVVGWYHSHPHITVHPSSVDLRTQEAYQQLDTGFVGLIFNCFGKEADGHMENQVVAFRSQDLTEVNIPLVVIASPVPVDVLSKLVDILNVLKSEELAYRKEAASKGGDLDVLHSSAVYNKSLTKLVEYGYLPLIRVLKQRLEANKREIEELKKQQDEQQSKILVDQLLKFK